ncbi:hypothetical protein [Poseidonibacter ostreae]|uniref:Uncharacterized protein n=1 Tax=Poseidonibacter ostreae TaxID=2654171 RepID=A0A6L4WWM8_9BACT|nr:hypothetical protein [Poseidonibacter ostreae]KAB7891291.1 hypothetical protein GBG19_00210 [Poseidonibacter ostreae]
MSLKTNDSKLHERARNNEAVRIQKRNNYYLFLVFAGAMSYAFYDMFFTYGSQNASLFSNPFNNSGYIQANYSVMTVMFTSTIIIYLFHFGKMKRNYVKRLEKIKQGLFNLFPFYFTGKDERNLYFRFGLKESLVENFVERKIHRQDYLKKVSFLSVFIEEQSPHALFQFKNGSADVSKYFNNENDYLDVFKIIEGYLIDNKNIDIFQNFLDLKDFKAIGSFSPRYTKESVKYFLNSCGGEKTWKKFAPIFDDKNLSQKDKSIEIKKNITAEFGAKGFNNYKTDVSKMVVFSSKALHTFLEKIYNDSKSYYYKIKLFKTKAYSEMMSYGDIDEEKLFTTLVFCHFFKVINLFMGLPSGVVTARIEDYHLARILDDFEHFENSIGIREIKRKINDKNSKFDDTFPRSFMIFYHDYYANSKNRELLSNVFSKFDPLVSLDVSDREVDIPSSFGTYDSESTFTPTSNTLPSEEEDIESVKKQEYKAGV